MVNAEEKEKLMLAVNVTEKVFLKDIVTV